MSDTIQIPGIYDVSGPTGSVGRPTSYGTRDAIKYINDNGLLPYQIEHEWVDYQRDISRAEDAYTQFTSENTPPAILGWGAGDTKALADRLARDEIVYISASYSPEFHRPEYPYLFVPSLDYTSQVRIHLEWVSEHDPSAKVALMYPDRPLGHAIKDGSHRYAEELDIEMGPDLHLSVDADSAKNQLATAAQEDIDYLIHHNIAQPTRVVLEEKQASFPELDVLGLSWTVDELQLAGAPDLYEGVRFVNTFSTFQEVLKGDARGHEAILSAFEEYRGMNEKENPEIANLHYVRGFLHGLLLYKAIKTADQRDLDAHDGQHLRQALFDVADWDAWGLSEGLTYSNKDPRAIMSGRIYEVCNGMLKYEETIDLPRTREWIGV